MLQTSVTQREESEAEKSIRGTMPQNYGIREFKSSVLSCVVDSTKVGYVKTPVN